MSDAKDPLKGYRGHARARLEEWGMRVWGDVRVKNTAGSTFEGVILPRGETFDASRKRSTRFPRKNFRSRLTCPTLPCWALAAR